MKALITGASSGVGLAITRELLNTYPDIEIIAQYNSQRPDIEDERLRVWQADFTQPLADLLAVGDSLDLLIHCAGVCPLGSCAESTRAQWEEAMAVNLHSPAELTAALLPQLKKAGAHVIYINSGAGMNTRPLWGAYSASKFAARAWCEALRQENPEIRVSSIYPGRIATPMQEKVVEFLGETWDPSKYLSVDTVKAAAMALVKAPADCQPQDIVLRPRG